MKIAVVAESQPGESRVAASPDTVKGYIKKGLSVAIAAGGAEVRGGVQSTVRAPFAVPVFATPWTRTGPAMPTVTVEDAQARLGELIDRLLRTMGSALDDAGDRDEVTELLAQKKAEGTSAELKRYLRNSYDLVRAKLPKKVQAELAQPRKRK